MVRTVELIEGYSLQIFLLTFRNHEATVHIKLAREAKEALAELKATSSRNLTDNTSKQPLRTLQALPSPVKTSPRSHKTPPQSSGKKPTIVIEIVDSDGEEASSPSSSLPRKNLFNTSPTAASEVARVAMLGSLIPESPDYPVEDNSFSSEGSTKKRKSGDDWSDQAVSRRQEKKPRERPLQTNTCKVCERVSETPPRSVVGSSRGRAGLTSRLWLGPPYGVVCVL